MRRVALQIRGIVQGVGFRPHVYNLAQELELTGWVMNSSVGVIIEVEGPTEKVTVFTESLRESPPRHARIVSFEIEEAEPEGDPEFYILRSEENAAAGALVLPDLAICDDCRRELFDAGDRRYRYPFINCTNCGPRFSIIQSIPYDRESTTMSAFTMCDACQTEYDHPANRRFHAQPNACHDCGPHVTLRTNEGELVERHADAIARAAAGLRTGQVIAVKGLGGFHLMADARDTGALRQLRSVKRRPSKPLAVMFPDMDSLRQHCDVDTAEARILESAAAPIVLVSRRNPDEVQGDPLSEQIAPDNPYVGAFLPYTPLHLLLLDELNFPVVATSGNLSDEPICTDVAEALERLEGIADLFLDHNRPIERPVEDSVVMAFRDEEIVLRRGRGYAPAPVATVDVGGSVSAVGGDLKGATALLHASQVILGPHVGDLAHVRSQDAFSAQLRDLPELYDSSVELTAHDAHPDYFSTRIASRSDQPVRVQHHHAHVVSTMVEHSLSGPVLGVAWDGTGWGPDGTIWGGEFLVVTRDGFERVGHLRRFDLPGGDVAAREPRRSALALLHAMEHSIDPIRYLFDEEKLEVLRLMLDGNVRAIGTSSAGRLFDGVACLLGLGPPRVTFEAEAALALEFRASLASEAADLPSMPFREGALDWRPVVSALVDRAAEGDHAALAAGFHAALAEGICRVAEETGIERCALVGGCFQNRVLLEETVTRLEARGFQPFWNRQIPPGDGGLAAGQAVAAAWRLLHDANG